MPEAEGNLHDCQGERRSQADDSTHQREKQRETLKSGETCMSQNEGTRTEYFRAKGRDPAPRARVCITRENKKLEEGRNPNISKRGGKTGISQSRDARPEYLRARGRSCLEIGQSTQKKEWATDRASIWGARCLGAPRWLAYLPKKV